jgi:predicted oxidoreductase
VTVSASDITLGTMRMDAGRYTAEQWGQFLIEVHGLGVTSLHVSDEYESWPLFLQSLAAARTASADIGFRFVAKLGEPHFDKPAFDSGRLEGHVEQYCSLLHVDCLDDIQWMWRADLDQDGKRCADFAAQADAIRSSVKKLKQSGMIRRFLCFPYSTAFAELALDLDFVDGLVVYHNARERVYEAHLDQCRTKSKMAHIIRPFFGGATLAADALEPRQQLINALDHPAIETAILSTGNMAHLHDLLA